MARLLEHHALEIFRKQGIAVPEFAVISVAEEAERAVAEMGGSAFIKAVRWGDGEKPALVERALAVA